MYIPLYLKAGTDIFMSTIDGLAGQCLVQMDWAELEQDELTVPAVIRFFDLGHMAVFVTDAAGNYLGGIYLLDFECTFPQPDCMVFRDLSLPYAEDDMENRLALFLWQREPH